MSMKENENWVQWCYENFQQAIKDGDMVAAKDCIADMLDIDRPTGRSMNEELRATPISNWNIRSSYPEI